MHMCAVPWYQAHVVATVRSSAEQRHAAAVSVLHTTGSAVVSGARTVVVDLPMQAVDKCVLM